MYKDWLVIITCASSRGIYLDLVHERFIKVLRRFISNRESPHGITSDNGKDFTSDDAQNFANSLNIKWKFSTEGAP